jgi:hypothetical protein
MLKSLFATFILSSVLASCVTLEPSPSYGVRISEADWPYQELGLLVANLLPTGLRATSPNGREFHSRYFVLDENNNYKPAGIALDRYSAYITVLGADRPYQLEVIVDHEKRILRDSGYDYKIVGHDKELATKLATQLIEKLTKRREDRNIIDDFRVF